MNKSRRHLLVAAPMVLTAGGLVAADARRTFAANSHKDETVPAVQDLMREHGILRRILLAYRETAQRMRTEGKLIEPQALYEATELFVMFGERYHEKAIEEPYVFPAVRKAGGPAAAYVDILIRQHDRGRELTTYMLSILKKRSAGGDQVQLLANIFDALDLMYENHTAREDTVVFPAFQNALSPHQYEDMSGKFEQIEKTLPGLPDYQEALQRITGIEQTLGYADLGQFTAQRPPAPT